MPTNLIKNTGHFVGINSVLASEIGLRAARMLTMDMTQFAPLAGQNIVLQPGTVICQLASGMGRAYPASKAVATTATTSKIIKVDNPTVFKVGDVLTQGTIASIDAATGNITLAADASAAIAVGDAIVGDAASAGTPYGIIISEIDITTFSNDVACYTSASVFRERLPYWSAALQTALPEITMVDPK